MIVLPVDPITLKTLRRAPLALQPRKRFDFMNKTQLIDVIAKHTQLTKTSVEDVLNTTLETIKKSVKKGDDVTLVGFGTFTRSKRKARSGINPQTGKEIKIPAMTVPRFRPGKEFKESVR
jgi:DNA-binding protein HU-beta